MLKPVGFDSRRRQALDSIQQAICASSKPVVLSSFGKDSLCLLALIEAEGVKSDVAYFELGAIEAAHRFARKTISERNLTITMLRPHNTFLVGGEGGVAIAYQFDLVGGDALQIVGATFDDNEHPELLCGIRQGLIKTGNHSRYNWNLVMTGRRSADVDPTLGHLNIGTGNVCLPNGAHILMPLLQWTDADVAYFLTSQRDYAPDWDRYKVFSGKLQNIPDSSSNPDHAHICIRCLAANAESGEPKCPLTLNTDIRYALHERRHFVSGQIPATVML